MAQRTSIGRLSRELNGWQVFFIALSAVIGTGIFGHDGLALNLAGPIGLVLATIVVGLIVVAVMDGLSELIQVFPCSNALVEYVHHFIDPDLGICVGIVYWFGWSVYFSLQLGAAADICSAWSLNSPKIDIILRVVVFFFVVPALLGFINTRKVSLFGWIETVGGFAKLLIVVAMSLMLYYLAGVNEGVQSGMPSSDLNTLQARNTYLSDGFTGSADFPNARANFFAVLPIVVFSWTGVEIVAVTAYEAVDLLDLRLPSQRIPYVVFVVYLICAIGSGMAVRHNNDALATIYRDQASIVTSTSGSALEDKSPISSSGSLIVIAANQVGKYTMAQAFNGLLIFSAISAANTALYVASRTLYGLAANHILPNPVIGSEVAQSPHDSADIGSEVAQISYGNAFCRFFARVESNGVPMRAVWFSALACCVWLPWLSLVDIPAQDQSYTRGTRAVDAGSQQFLNTISSLCVVFVWGTICLAFIRYYYWLAANPDFLRSEYPDIDRLGSQSSTSTMLKRGQPYVAWFGLGACFLVVMVFPIFLLVDNAPHSSAATAYQVFQVYLTPIFILVLWILLKIARLIRGGPFSLWVRIGGKDELRAAIVRLKNLSEVPRDTN